MCEAYDAEWNWITLMEGRAAIQGFTDAANRTLAGREKTSYPDKYEHGVMCYVSKSFPWEILKEFSVTERNKLEKKFAKTGKVPPEIKRLLSLK